MLRRKEDVIGSGCQGPAAGVDAVDTAWSDGGEAGSSGAGEVRAAVVVVQRQSQACVWRMSQCAGLLYLWALARESERRAECAGRSGSGDQGIPRVPLVLRGLREEMPRSVESGGTSARDGHCGGRRLTAKKKRVSWCQRSGSSMLVVSIAQ